MASNHEPFSHPINPPSFNSNSNFSFRPRYAYAHAHAHDHDQVQVQLHPHQPTSLSGIALRAFLLGASFSLGLGATFLSLVVHSSPLWRLPFFLAALSLFHFLEFWTTARNNVPQAKTAAFLLTSNWPAYPIAHAVACVECLVRHRVLVEQEGSNMHGGGNGSSTGTGTWGPRLILLLLGLVAVVVGQTVRSLAMVHAGTSFNHTVQTTRRAEHRLVTTGVYALLRHPSYFGFFYWALGTQLVLGNGFCCFVYAGLLLSFFRHRVRAEERKLVEFFGDEYIAYRDRVGTMIPFVG